MPQLDEADALALWESGERLSMLDRAVRLAAVLGGTGIEAAADLPLPQRDRLLLAALRQMGGPSAAVVATCPECGTLHEADVALAPLLETRDAAAPQVTFGDRPAALRPPTSRDLAAAVVSGDAATLAERCCDAPGALADPAAIEEALDSAFPLLNIMIAMDCDDCGAQFARRFDPVPLLWAQVTARAKAALATVDCLARAYGWSEAEIFALSPTRRQLYREMALQ
ncbi:hypothetical protein [Erythrobacter colymbi]|uniref:hypothetical protein n=1 Tax=Erythrobacter colymbi TaxID=1161202 RepID=UPI000A3B8E7A|nr:hypothetical protein [Erythrobacter colymbi]